MKKLPILIFTHLSTDPTMVTMTTTVLDNANPPVGITNVTVKLHKNEAGLPEYVQLTDQQQNGIYTGPIDKSLVYILIVSKKGYKTIVKYVPANAANYSYTLTLLTE